MSISANTPSAGASTDTLSYPVRTGLMLAAMLFYAVGDSSAKLLSGRVDIAFIMIGQGVGGLVLFMPISLARGELGHLRKLLNRPVIIRNIAELTAPFLVLNAMVFTPLAIIGSLMQLQPLFVLAMAALFLREKVGWHRWASVFVGFASVLLILRPGTDGFSVWAVVAILGVVALAVRDVATRLIDNEIPTNLLTTLSLGVQGVFGLTLLACQGIERVPYRSDYGFMLVLIVCAGMAFTLTTTALRSGNVAVVTPYRYSRLVYLLIISVVFFGERPDVWVLTGAALITLSGLYVFWRERRLARAQRA